MQTICNSTFRLHIRVLAILFCWESLIFLSAPQVSVPTLSPEHPLPAPVSSRPISPCAQHPQSWKITQAQGTYKSLALASTSCCLLPTPPESAVEMLTVLRQDKMAFLPSLPASRQSPAAGRSPGRNPCGRTGSISESQQELRASVPQHPLQTFPLCSSQYIKKWN